MQYIDWEVINTPYLTESTAHIQSVPHICTDSFDLGNIITAELIMIKWYQIGM